MAARVRKSRPKTSFPALEWLTDASGLKARVTLLGSSRAMVENHTGILEFTEGVIRLKTRDGMLRFEGSGLALTEVRPDALTVRGAISRVIFLTGKEADDA